MGEGTAGAAGVCRRGIVAIRLGLCARHIAMVRPPASHRRGRLLGARDALSVSSRVRGSRRRRTRVRVSRGRAPSPLPDTPITRRAWTCVLVVVMPAGQPRIERQGRRGHRRWQLRRGSRSARVMVARRRPALRCSRAPPAEARGRRHGLLRPGAASARPPRLLHARLLGQWLGRSRRRRIGRDDAVDVAQPVLLRLPIAKACPAS
mmetsp:Transcript_35108/g.113095  ORF Transcript_35108/g.113095 Transcript_35108/m.113095 type:complete len:206 (+) Transcript_35108:2259-2876(+)